MQGEGLETVQVPSVRLVSPNSPASSPRRCRLSSGGYTTNQPISPEDIPLSPEQEGQCHGLVTVSFVRSCVTSRHAQVVGSDSEKSEHLQWLETWEV